jgi:NYN domain
VAADEVRERRSALFVDFDNVYLGLSRIDSSIADTFARDPGRWVAWLQDGRDGDGPFRRRFLTRACYLNPGPFGRFRSFFASAGFRVVDCPSLTQAGKSSADIHLVLDVLDALNHPTHYDEFVICSADSDFTPLMVRLRAHDRRTVMVAAGNAAAAYEAVVDEAIGPVQLAEALATPAISAVATVNIRTSHATEAAGRPAKKHVVRALAAINDAVAAAAEPLAASSAAHAARVAAPAISGTDWDGVGSFLAFVEERLPNLRVLRTAQGGWILDPARHRDVDIPEAKLPEDLPTQVSRVTHAPRLTSQQYAVLFEELAAQAATQPFDLGLTSRTVRDRIAERGEAVGRNAVNFVLQGLIYAGVIPADTARSPRELALAWLENVLALCRNARMELTEADQTTIHDWIVGGLAGHRRAT